MALGILGGMGPQATCQLFQRIIKLTNAENDQDHIHTIIDSNTKIPDRTEYILGNGKDPRPEMIKSIVKLEAMGVDNIAIPCNTAHFFYDDIKKYTKVNIINMIYEAGNYLRKNNKEDKEYLLLATEGTYKTRVYEKYFNAMGLNILVPDDRDKKILMTWIYKVKSSAIDIELKEFEELVSKYTEAKDIPIIIGCTELSVLVEEIKYRKKYFDSMTILAKKCVELSI
ncbi:MAG: amino acid racemase [Tissierellaceae bacterium]|nr:amino acid racemase [Tissierellaceae bacterium]